MQCAHIVSEDAVEGLLYAQRRTLNRFSTNATLTDSRSPLAYTIRCFRAQGCSAPDTVAIALSAVHGESRWRQRGVFEALFIQQHIKGFTPDKIAESATAMFVQGLDAWAHALCHLIRVIYINIRAGIITYLLQSYRCMDGT